MLNRHLYTSKFRRVHVLLVETCPVLAWCYVRCPDYELNKLMKTYGKFCRSYFLTSVRGGGEGQRRSEFFSSGSEIVKRFQRRQCDPATIEITICLVLGPFVFLYRSFLKSCTLTNKAVGTI